MGLLTDRVALVTGAGQGIGQGIAYALAAEGAAIAAVGRTAGKLDETVAGIERRGGKAIPIVADITDPLQVAHAIDRTVADLERLDILVNNAQAFAFGSIADIALETVEAGWRSGPLATLLLMRAARRHLRGGGVVINVSAAAAIEPSIGRLGIYAACKSAIESIGRAAAVEWAGDGVRVVTVMPLARTPAVQAALDANPGFEQQLLSTVPLGRLGSAETDIGAAVAFLCSAAAGYITGTTISVDGGSVRLR